MTDRLRVAVAGMGAVAESVYLPLLTRRWDLFELAAICDLSPSLRDELGDQYHVSPDRRYADVAQLLADTQVDGVILLTSGSHGAVALDALRRGVPVFCEKPLAFTLAEADELAAAEAELGRPALLLAYMKEHDEAVWRMREKLASVDDVRAVEVCVLHPTAESQLAFANLHPRPHDVEQAAMEALHKRQAELLDQALGSDLSGQLRELYVHVVLLSLIHDTSLLRALFGGLTEVDDARAWPAGVFPPSVEVTGALPGGARARMTWHYLPDYPAYRETLVVHHGRGTLQVTFGTPYPLNGITQLDVIEAVPGGELRSTFSTTRASFENELIDFHRMVTAGTRPRAGIAEGRADIRTSQRIVRVLGERRGEKLGGEAASG